MVEKDTSTIIKSKEVLEAERIINTQHLTPSTDEKGEDDGSGVLMSSGSQFFPVRLGILGTDRTNRKTVSAIRNPISLCTVTAVASKDRRTGEKFIEDWCSHPQGGTPNDIGIYVGDGSFHDLIESEGLIDAIFIPYPETFRKDWVIRSLECGKHVIMDFPVSMTLADVVEIISAAKNAGKILMDASKFVHEQRTQEFLARIADPAFGPIGQIDAEFSVLGDDKTMDEHMWLSKHDDELGCIGSLGWFCARMAVAIFEEVGGGVGKIKTAQIMGLVKNAAGNPVDANAKVTFDNGCIFTLKCSFSHPSKQSVKVFGDNYSAEMFDVYHSHDIFTSFQIHKKEFSSDEMIQGPIEIVDSVECRSGPLQDAYIWRKFGDLCRGIDDAVLAHKLPLQTAEWPDGPASKEANMLLTSSIETQMIVDALVESLRKDCAEISLPIPASS